MVFPLRRLEVMYINSAEQYTGAIVMILFTEVNNLSFPAFSQQQNIGIDNTEITKACQRKKRNMGVLGGGGNAAFQN